MLSFFFSIFCPQFRGQKKNFNSALFNEIMSVIVKTYQIKLNENVVDVSVVCFVNAINLRSFVHTDVM